MSDERMKIVLDLLPSDAVTICARDAGGLWAPGGCGYVFDIWTAGIFDPSDAHAIRFSDVGEHRWRDHSYTETFAATLGRRTIQDGTIIAALVDEIARLRAEIDALTLLSLMVADVSPEETP